VIINIYIFVKAHRDAIYPCLDLRIAHRDAVLFKYHKDKHNMCS